MTLDPEFFLNRDGNFSTRAWKFLDPKHAKSACEGCFRIASPQSYAAIKGPQADLLDAAVKRFLPFAYVADGSSEDEKDQVDLLQSMGIVVLPGAKRITLVNNTGVNRTLGLTLCLSRTPNPIAFPGKSAIIEISDVAMLGKLISEANDLAEPQWARVSYGQNEFVGAVGPRLGSPFLKAKNYEAEQEVRIYWPALTLAEAVITKPVELPPGLVTWINQ